MHAVFSNAALCRVHSSLLGCCLVEGEEGSRRVGFLWHQRCLASHVSYAPLIFSSHPLQRCAFPSHRTHPFCQYGSLHPNAEGMGDSELPTCVRGVYLIDPERKLQLRLTYPISVGRNFFEIIRVLDSLQITSYHQVRKGLTGGLDGRACSLCTRMYGWLYSWYRNGLIASLSTVPIDCYTSALQHTSLAVLVAPSCSGHHHSLPHRRPSHSLP